MDEVRKHNGHDRLTPRQRALLEWKATVRRQLEESQKRQREIADEASSLLWFFTAIIICVSIVTVATIAWQLLRP